LFYAQPHIGGQLQRVFIEVLYVDLCSIRRNAPLYFLIKASHDSKGEDERHHTNSDADNRNSGAEPQKSMCFTARTEQ
jgi:hypothetical protein